MLDGFGSLGLGLALFIPSLALTAGALWLAARMAPWFLRTRFRPIPVRSFFTEFNAEAELDRHRMMTLAVAGAIILAVITPLFWVIRLGAFAG